MQRNGEPRENATHYRQLIGWQRALDLVVACYQIADRLPISERYGLSGQLRRAVVSVPANIAEGQGRGSQADFARCLTIARGSLMEVETHLIVAERLKYLSPAEVRPALALSSEVGRILNGLIRRVRTRARESARRTL
jgi:four helix bundle protein